MIIAILAAGYAVRLRPLTLKTPKPLLPVGGKTMLDRIVDKIYGLEDVKAIHIVTNATFYENFSSWLKGRRGRSRISLTNDGTISNETRMGAIRDLEIIIKKKNVDDDLLVIAGDNLFDFELARFIEFARAHADGVSIAVHDIRSLEEAKKFGVVKLDAGAKVVDFEEKPESPGSTFVSTGIYYFPSSKIHIISDYLKKHDKVDAPGHYIHWLSKTGSVYGFTFHEDWIDIGSIESYNRADEVYTKKERKRNVKK
jgi:glucose-1-phosphate thymidylyltransferase